MSHYRSLLRLGFPIIVGQLGTIAVNWADTLMIGHYGTPELAAASFVNQLFTLVILFGMGFSYGLTPIVGALTGKNDLAAAGQALRGGLIANTLMALLLTLLTGIAYLCLDYMGQPAELLPLIRPYLLLQIASLVPLMLFNGFKQFADGITCTSLSMWILLAGNVLNIAGNYLLIFGRFGCPEWGLVGAGVSTLSSRIFATLFFLLILLTHRRFRRYRMGFFRLGRSLTLFRQLWSMGMPVALQIGMESASFSLSAIMVGWLGSTELATYQIMIAVSQVCFMMYYGMGAAVSVRISHFCGQHDWNNVRRTANQGFHLILLIAACSCLPIFLMRHDIGGWFTADATVSGMVAQVIFPFLLYQFGDGLQINYANALRGIADVRPMLVFAFIAYFVISLPLSYVFGFVLHGGLFGIWMSYPFGLTSAGLMYYFRFRKKSRSASGRKI